jgi:hypothetical protein
MNTTEEKSCCCGVEGCAGSAEATSDSAIDIKGLLSPSRHASMLLAGVTRCDFGRLFALTRTKLHFSTILAIFSSAMTH